MKLAQLFILSIAFISPCFSDDTPPSHASTPEEPDATASASSVVIMMPTADEHVTPTSGDDSTPIYLQDIYGGIKLFKFRFVRERMPFLVACEWFDPEFISKVESGKLSYLDYAWVMFDRLCYLKLYRNWCYALSDNEMKDDALKEYVRRLDEFRSTLRSLCEILPWPITKMIHSFIQYNFNNKLTFDFALSLLAHEIAKYSLEDRAVDLFEGTDDEVRDEADVWSKIRKKAGDDSSRERRLTLLEQANEEFNRWRENEERRRGL